MKSVQIQLTTKCNQRCYMCRKYTWPENNIDIDVLRRKIEEYKECTFTFSGGDPLSYEYLQALNEILNHNNISYQVFTNLNYELDEIMQNFLANADCVQISLDGISKEVYDSVRRPIQNGVSLVKANIRWAKKNCKEIKINCTVSKRNYFEFPSIVKWCKSNIPNSKLRFFPVHTEREAMLTDTMFKTIDEAITEMLKDESLANYMNKETNLLQFEMKPRENYNGPCYVRKEHRLIDEDGHEYTCCRAINDNGNNWDSMFSIDTNEIIRKKLNDEKFLYPYCMGCDRYRKFNENWDDYKDKEKLYL